MKTHCITNIFLKKLNLISARTVHIYTSVMFVFGKREDICTSMIGRLKFTF